MSDSILLNDTVFFGCVVSNPSGGALVNADATPRWYAYKNASDTPVLQGPFEARSNLIGTYRSSFPASVASGFASNDFVEIHASGMVNGVVGRAIIKTFVIDDLYYADVQRVSGVPVQVSTFYNPDIYFANIKYVKDNIVGDDEYTVQWYRNTSPLASGNVTNPAISVYKTSDGSALFANKTLTYASLNLGVLRYNATDISVSGEPYLVSVSGTIDGSVRVWNNLIGVDAL